MKFLQVRASEDSRELQNLIERGVRASGLLGAIDLLTHTFKDLLDLIIQLSSVSNHQFLRTLHVFSNPLGEPDHCQAFARPLEYTAPNDGPVGKILDAAGRHPWRPSHLHFVVKAEGFRSLVTEVFPDDDPYLDQDTVFGVRDDLIMTYVEQPARSFPDGYELTGQVPDAFSRVDFDFALAKDAVT